MKAVKIYFVLYIVLLCELFLVILDRDEAIDAWFKYLENQDPLCELRYSNSENETLLIPPFNNNQSNGNRKTIVYHLYPSGFISTQEIEKAEICVKIRDYRNSFSWSKLNVRQRNPELCVTDQTRIDSLVDDKKQCTILLEKISGLDYLFTISYERGFLDRFQENDTLRLSSIFSTTGKLPLDEKSENLESQIIHHINKSIDKFPNLSRVTKQNPIKSKELKNIQFVSVLKGNITKPDD